MIRCGNNIIDVDDYAVISRTDGENILKFSINVENEGYSLIWERAILNADGQDYVVTYIDMDLSIANVEAVIDTSDWKGDALPDFTTGTPITLQEVALMVIPDGWSLHVYNYSSKRRLVVVEGISSPYGVLQEAHKYFDFALQFDNQTKTINIYQNPGSYFNTPVMVMDGLNLDRLEYKGKADEFFTVLYAEGAEGLTFADINNNKAYVEDFTYSNERIIAYWKDERYTVKENLLEDARAKLYRAAHPEITYTCSIKDLYAMDGSEYPELRLGLLSTVRVIDYSNDVTTDMIVSEYEDHPLNPENNVITLSSDMEPVKGIAQAINDAVAEEAEQRSTEVELAFKKMQEIVENSSGLYTTTVTDPGGAAIYYLHDQERLADSTIIWRMSAEIFSVSTDGGNTWNTGLTADGNIIAQRLAVVGIDAEWIRIGKIAESQLATALQDKIDSNIVSVSVQYAKNQSQTTAPTTGWQDNAPQWEEGYFIWQRTKTEEADGTISYSAALCITGIKGDTGDTGVGISSIEEQWYLSTSDQSPTDGSWSQTQQVYEAGKYYWFRNKITYDDGTTAYTTAVLANGINNANSSAASAVSTANAASTAAAGATGISTDVRNKLIALCTDNNMTSIDGGVIAAATILANSIDLNNLFAQNITATNFNITGGSIQITTSTGTTDFIQLKYGTKFIYMCPSYLRIRDSNNGGNDYWTYVWDNGIFIDVNGTLRASYYMDGIRFLAADSTMLGNYGIDWLSFFATSGDVALSLSAHSNSNPYLRFSDVTSAKKLRMELTKTFLSFNNSGGYELAYLSDTLLRFKNGGGYYLSSYSGDGVIIRDGSGTEKASLGNTGKLGLSGTAYPQIVGNATYLKANFTNNNGSGWTLSAGKFMPTVDRDLDLGDASYRWKQVYATNSAINTSDRREKHDIEDVSDIYLRLFDMLRPVSYMRNGGDRVHIGFISQEVEEALTELGMRAEDFAGFCKDEKKAPPEYDEEGNIIKEEETILDEEGKPDYRYALRYEEFIALNTAKIKAQEKQIEAMDRYIKALEERISTLEARIN